MLDKSAWGTLGSDAEVAGLADQITESVVVNLLTDFPVGHAAHLHRGQSGRKPAPGDEYSTKNARSGWRSARRTSTSNRPYAFGGFGFPVHVSELASATCTRCRTEHLAIRSPQRFHAAIVEEVLKKPGALSATEIAFLRKELQLTGGQFAALVGVSREHISRIDQGHALNLGTTADRLARLMIAAKTDPSLKLLKRLLASLDESIGTRSRRKAVRHAGYHVALGSARRSIAAGC